MYTGETNSVQNGVKSSPVRSVNKRRLTAKTKKRQSVGKRAAAVAANKRLAAVITQPCTNDDDVITDDDVIADNDVISDDDIITPDVETTPEEPDPDYSIAIDRSPSKSKGSSRRKKVGLCWNGLLFFRCVS